MATILLTGATGTVGSSLASLLKKNGHKLVYLIRGRNSRQRLFEALGKIGREDIVLRGDMTLPRLGISNLDKRGLKGKIDKIVNCAASIRFDDASAKETTKINVDGVKELLELAKELRVPEFHQVSTAYVAGDADYFSEEDFDIGQNPRNVYEETKKQAEYLVRNWRFGKHSIYRLGIVVGDYNTGYTPTFNGYYVFASSLWHLRKILLGKSRFEINEYKEEGIKFDSDDMLTLPIYLNFSLASTLNITPVDWTGRMLSKLIAVSADNQVFHVINPRPRRARWINDISLKHLGIRGFYYGDFADYSSRSLLGKLQKIYDRTTVQYLPYVTHECRFDTVNALRVLGSEYELPPDIDEMFIVTMLDYAKSVNFGRKEQTVVKGTA